MAMKSSKCELAASSRLAEAQLYSFERLDSAQMQTAGRLNARWRLPEVPPSHWLYRLLT